MNNVLIFTDPHITQSSLKECISIFEEIGMLANKYKCDTVIDAGDTFDSLKPNSVELDVFATFIRRLNKKIIILAANSHESTTEEESIVNHFGILTEKVTVCKEFKDGNHLYVGHFSIKESISNYDAKQSKEDFKDYLYVFLGHIHSYQLIKPNIVHLGSCRYINFNEAGDKQKVVALISDYGTDSEKVHFLKLKSPIPMLELKLSKNASLEGSKDTSEPKKDVLGSSCEGILPLELGIEAVCQKLDQLDPRTKVKVKIMDFESFKQFIPLCSKYSTKFETFKYDTIFEFVPVNNQKCKDTETKGFAESFTSWLRQQNVDPKIKEILQKEVE